MARRYWAASYGTRYGDPLITFVALEPLRDTIVGASGRGRIVQAAADRAAEYERNELLGYCEDECGDEGCAFCNPDIVTYGVSLYDAADLFVARELCEHRHELAQGKVIALSR